MTPDVEIYVLVYNDGDVGRRAIESVLDQTYKNFRLTILENGSTDDTRVKISKFLKDPRVRSIRNEINVRSGMVSKTLPNCDAKYLSVLFSDDYYFNNRLEIMLNSIGDGDALFSNNLYINQYEKLVPPPHYISTTSDVTTLSPYEHLRRFFVSGNSLHPCSLLINSDVYRKLDGYPAHFHRMGDMVFFTKLLASADVHFIADRLQYITVWDDGRNESAANASDFNPSLVEVQRFAELFAKEPIISHIEEIFGSHLEPITLDGKAERLWYFGVITLSIGDYWKRNLGYRCLHEALSLDEERINANVVRTVGMSAGEYIATLSKIYPLFPTPFVTTQPSVAAPPGGEATLRQALARIGLLRGIYHTLNWAWFRAHGKRLTDLSAPPGPRLLGN